MKNTHFKTAFTHIELIFIIVIISILAAIALPRLAATRDDASLATDVSNMSACIQDSASQYTATGSIGTSVGCDKIVCYSITDTDPENFTVVLNPAGASFCSDIASIGAELARVYTFKGTGISF